MAISGADFPISVGMEFFNYLQQPLVNKYVENKLAEEKFLKAVSWQGHPFDFYRFQVRFPYYRGGETVALNAPRSLTSKVAKVGVANLSQEEKELLPPHFTLGSSAYFERFKAVVDHHGNMDPATLQRYFEAQSIWDDTMAWQAKMAMDRNPDQVLVVIVGDFHVKYGGGLPDRLRARGVEAIVNISQLSLKGLSQEQALKLVMPHPTYGPRADFVWVSE